MKFRGAHIVLLALLLAASCSGPRKIPRDKMVLIYHDMFLQDQQIKSDFNLRRFADTSLVYEGIFQAYGYDTDDYLYSVSKYIENPEKMSKIFGKVAVMLENEARDIKKEAAFQEWRSRYMSIYARKVDTTRGPRVPEDIIDSLHFRLVGQSIEFFPPEDTLAWDLDTLVFSRDTVVLDSLAP